MLLKITSIIICKKIYYRNWTRTMLKSIFITTCNRSCEIRFLKFTFFLKILYWNKFFSPMKKFNFPFKQGFFTLKQTRENMFHVETDFSSISTCKILHFSKILRWNRFFLQPKSSDFFMSFYYFTNNYNM